MGNVSDNEIVASMRRKNEDRRLTRDEEAQTEGFLRVTTAPNPRSSQMGFDAGQRGWRLHMVQGVETDNFSDLPRKALCGVRAAHGWSLDLFIDQECERCTKAFARLQDRRCAYALTTQKEPV